MNCKSHFHLSWFFHWSAKDAHRHIAKKREVAFNLSHMKVGSLTCPCSDHMKLGDYNKSHMWTKYKLNLRSQHLSCVIKLHLPSISFFPFWSESMWKCPHVETGNTEGISSFIISFRHLARWTISLNSSMLSRLYLFNELSCACCSEFLFDFQYKTNRYLLYDS